MVNVERIHQHIREDKEKRRRFISTFKILIKTAQTATSPSKRSGERKKINDLRPKIVLTNEEFIYFEVDLIIGAEQKGAILTIVERKTNFLIMKKLKGKNAKELLNVR